MADLEQDVDALYQGPLADFITARNTLAKAAKRPDLKTLEKPALPAWAVNQLYWHERDVFEAVVHAAAAMHEAHRQTLAGTPANVRDAESAHRAAIRAAVTAATAQLARAALPATAATLDAITRTLEALPSPDAQGRLVRPLAPAGLEALAGLTVVAPERPILRVVSSRPAPAVVDDAAEQARTEVRERAARERQARRDAAAAAVEAAKAALIGAEAAVGHAEDALAAAQASREAARLALRQATRELDTI